MNPKEHVNTPIFKRMVLGAVALLAVVAQAVSQATDATVVTNDPAALQIDTNAPVKVVQPARVELPAELAEVVRLAESGTDEAVIVAYIEKSPAYRITSDQIVYLQDLGISQAVIKALVQHGPPAAEATVPAVPEPIPVQTNVPAAVPEAEPAPAAVTTGTTVNYFYQSLSPYGSWVEVAPYGLCWQPTVVIVNPYWRPYCDNGYWLWSDAGWYWRSYYSWGWAPFHYGRWFHHYHRGWIWWPDRVWAPAWVTWRSAPGYCGWAPLPPRSHFSAGVGWTFNGVSVGFNYSFGLGPSHYTFVPPAHFAHRTVSAHALSPRQVNSVFNNTTVNNNYVAGPNNRIINQGIDRRQVERASRTPLREVQVRELPSRPSRFTALDQVTRVGNADVVYRPSPQATVAPAPRVPRVAAPTSRPAPVRPPAAAAPRPTQPTRPGQAPRGTPPRTALETKPAERLMPGAGRPPSVPTIPSRPQQRQPSVQPRPAPSLQPRAPGTQPRSVPTPQPRAPSMQPRSVPAPPPRQPSLQPRSAPQYRSPAMQPRPAPGGGVQRAPQAPRGQPRGSQPRRSPAPITE